MSAYTTTPFWLDPHSPFALHPSTHWGTLPNGLSYVIMPHAEPPGRMSVRLYVETGSLMEDEDQRGLAHLVEHMAFQGSTHFPNGVVEYLQKMGLGFGPDTNASTSFDSTVYQLDLPDNQPATLTKALDILHDYAAGVHFDPQKLDNERQVVLAEKRQMDSSDYRSFVAYWDFLLKGTLVPERLPIGLESVIQGTPRQRIVDFYRSWYTPSRMAVVVAGDVDPQAVKAAIMQSLGSIPAAARHPDPQLGTLAHCATQGQPGVLVKVHQEPEASSTTIQLHQLRSFQRERYTQEDFRQDMERWAAHSMVKRRLRLMEKQPQARYFGSDSHSFDYLNFFQVACLQLSCEPQDWAAGVRVLEQTLRQVLLYGFDAYELELAKKTILNELEQAVKLFPTLKSRVLADRLVGCIEGNKPYLAPEEELRLAKTILDQLSPQSCSEAYKALWAEAQHSLFVRTQSSEPVSSQVTQVYQASQQERVDPWQYDEQKPFAYQNWGEAGAVVSKTYIEDLGIWQVRFANNLQLNIKRSDFEANTVRLALTFGGGMLEETGDKVGLGLLADMTFIEGGLKAHSLDDISQIFAGKRVHGSFKTMDECFCLTGEAEPALLQDALNLATAYLTAPGFRPEALTQAHKALEPLYRDLQQTPSGVFKQKGFSLLADKDPRFGYPDKEKLLRFTSQDLEAWLTPALTQSPLTLSVVGECDPDTIISLVAQTLGTLPARPLHGPAYLQERQVHFPTQLRRVEYPVATSIPKALVVVAWPTTDLLHIESARRLGVLAEVLENQMIKVLRDEKGQIYSARATHKPSLAFPKYGYLYTVAVTHPKDAESVSKDMLALGHSLSQGAISQDEFEKAINPILSGLQEQLRSNAFWLSLLMDANTYPQRLDWTRNLLQAHRSMTPADLYAVGKKYLDATRGLRILIVPQQAPAPTPASP